MADGLTSFSNNKCSDFACVLRPWDIKILKDAE